MKQFIGFKRLGEIINGARLNRFYRQFRSCVSRDHNNRKAGALFCSGTKEFVTTHTAQTSIGNDHEIFFLLNLAKGRLSRFGETNFILLAL